MPLTHEHLKELLLYFPDTGDFLWKTSQALAGTTKAKGYISIGIDGRSYSAHQLAWFYMTGKKPRREIDHKDRNPSNNRWNNLREATHPQNMANSKGIDKGVRYLPNGRWSAYIRVEGKQTYLGTFDSKEEARRVYTDSAYGLWGEFANP
jgi:hypothetical protein